MLTPWPGFQCWMLWGCLWGSLARHFYKHLATVLSNEETSFQHEHIMSAGCVSHNLLFPWFFLWLIYFADVNIRSQICILLIAWFMKGALSRLFQFSGGSLCTLSPINHEAVTPSITFKHGYCYKNRLFFWLFSHYRHAPPVVITLRLLVVSSPDPILRRGKGSGDYWTFSWLYWLIIAECMHTKADFNSWTPGVHGVAIRTNA